MMLRTINCIIAATLASGAIAAQKDDVRGLKIGMTAEQLRAALPECSNEKVFLADGHSVYCAVKGAEAVLDVDLTDKGRRAYVIEYSVKSDLTTTEPIASASKPIPHSYRHLPAIMNSGN